MSAVWNQMAYVYFKKHAVAIGVEKLHGQEVIIEHKVNEQMGKQHVNYMYGTIRNLEHHAPALAHAIKEVMQEVTGSMEYSSYLTVIEFKDNMDTHWLLFSQFQHAVFIAASRQYTIDVPDFQLPTIHKTGLQNGVYHMYSEEYRYYCLDPHDEAWTPLQSIPYTFKGKAGNDGDYSNDRYALVYVTPGYDNGHGAENILTGQGATIEHQCFVIGFEDFEHMVGGEWVNTFFGYSVMEYAQFYMLPWHSNSYVIPDGLTYGAVIRGRTLNDTVTENIRRGWDINGKKYYVSDGQYFNVQVQPI